ncbi:MAG: RagB/SusD family nutrient uptake outer membrane protein [Bacteroidales bacterium]|nr:RagB/SusD family nutrient uptake outer membrane protein [Bacteroidales bacterium]MBN2820937.1 RagB/SusD family nutrient uptake outer membrane protein [Bacteroidales bacterium]
MKKIIYTISLIAFVSLLFTECSEEFLNIKPIGKVNELSFFSDTANMDIAINGIYNAFEYKENLDVYDEFRMYMGSVASDEAECGGDTPTAWAEGYSYDELTYDPSASILEILYGAMFAGVSRASQVIEQLPEAKQLEGIDTVKVNVRLGEAHFLRAAFYFVLTRAFGGVPVVDHILLASEYNTIPRGTIKEVYTLMESDLKKAIKYLPLESEMSSGDKGRATKGSAQSLLAKMFVFEASYYTYYGTNDVRMGEVQDRWAEALYLCETVINSGEYELLGAGGETYETFWGPTTNGFRYLFSVEGNNNKESIFAIQHSLDQIGYNINRGTALNMFVGTRALYLDDAQTQMSSEGSHTWGFWAPTHKLYNMFHPDDVRRKVAIGEGPNPETGYKGDSIYCAPDGNEPGWYVIVPTRYPATGFEAFKYEIGPHLGSFQGLEWQANPQNQYYLRYADVVLLAAESAMMTNDQTKAKTYFNMIRERARNCGDGVNPADLSGDVTKKEIMDERSREFACEGERFFDLVRWHEAYNEINGTRMEWWDDSYNDLIYEEPKNDFFPLPSIDVSKNSSLNQYAGW